MAGLCEGDNEPPGSLKASKSLRPFLHNQKYSAVASRLTRRTRKDLNRQLLQSSKLYGTVCYRRFHSLGYLNENLTARWMSRRDAVEYSPRSPDLTPVGFYLWGTLNDVVYSQKPRTLDGLRESTVHVLVQISNWTRYSRYETPANAVIRVVVTEHPGHPLLLKMNDLHANWMSPLFCSIYRVIYMAP
ncbi:hypothetical protein ANN_04762 [Periplaneta americana]|uniref:Uncharacterized protein n=1 Tax=Periplaneta americana TaxID=6978 RepID=A0ABQ8T9A8_PERAM|nr:hypothetical protein ANN_04762 [Periplaneta americana]